MFFKFCLILAVFLSPLWAGTEVSSVTLPLAELMKLQQEHRQARAALQKQRPAAPVAASIPRLQLTGRLRDGAAEFKASFEVAILAENEWVRIPLLHLDEHVHIMDLPIVKDVTFIQEDGSLVLLTDKPGLLSFTLALLVQADRVKGGNQLTVAYHQATYAGMFMQADDRLFRVTDPQILRREEGYQVYPCPDKRLTFSWQPVSQLPQVVKQEALRPEIDATITTAVGAVVATREGRLIGRYLYQLHFEGSRPLSFILPEGYQLDKVYVNGRLQAAETVEGSLHLIVTPGKVGDRSGKVELVLIRPPAQYNLSGRLRFSAPAVSWPIQRFDLDLFLPEAFNYHWIGGSLSLSEKQAPMPFSHEIPTPGKRLSFHEYLVAEAAPSTVIDYTIDLTNQYFRFKRVIRPDVALKVYRED